MLAQIRTAAVSLASARGATLARGAPPPGIEPWRHRAAAQAVACARSKRWSATTTRVPGPVFVRGFIRNYAKLLGLDPEPLIRAADRCSNPPQRRRSRHACRNDRSRRADARECRLWPATIVVRWRRLQCRFIVGSHAAPEWSRVVGGRARRPEPASEAAAPANCRRAKPGLRAEAQTGSEPAPKPAAKPAAKRERSRSGPQATHVAARTEPRAADAAGRVTVRMIFEQESWVEIKDRNGNTIFGQLNPAGSRRSVSGEPPLSRGRGQRRRRAPVLRATRASISRRTPAWMSRA